MRFLSRIIKEVGNHRVTVALSAGCDSVAVAHFLKTKYPRRDLNCVHYNHSLREQNETMSATVEKFCKDYKIPLIIHKREHNPNHDLSEAGLRTLRYESFKNLGAVITGHHLDDAVESYLFNCFNGVPEYLPIPEITKYENLNFTIFRPFIISTKDDFKDYIRKHSLEEYIVEDETNKDQKYRRNWLRHQIVPEIEKYYNLRTIVKKRYQK